MISALPAHRARAYSVTMLDGNARSLCFGLGLAAALGSCTPSGVTTPATPAVGAPAPAPAAEPSLPVVAPPPGAAVLPSGGWAEADKILARIKPPTFPVRDCPITSHGAVAGGKTDATAAIRSAIEACSQQGGGRVVVPPGVFLTGAIHLKSNINLHVSAGATLLFATDPAAYLPVVLTRWEGIECMNFSPLIYALDQENIAITGTGTLDGGASDDNWWKWARKKPDRTSLATPDVKALNAMSEQNTPVESRVFGKGHYLRPNFIQPYRSKNVLIEGVTIVRSPMWEINPVLSTNITVRNLKIVTHGPNNDGVNPDSSSDVLIENTLFDVGDDCIAIKSGRNEDGRRVNRPSENIIIRGSTFKDGHAGVAIGSEIAGSCRNVFIENNRMDSPNLERALRLKSNARRGGVIENIYMRNIEVGQVSEALLTIDFMYEEGARGNFPPTARNITIENVKTKKSPRLFYVLGFEGATIDNIRVANSEIGGVTATEVLEHAGKVELDRVRIAPEVRPRSQSSRQVTAD
jgi:unsaturated rhamnogalacturonyl hydrolase